MFSGCSIPARFRESTICESGGGSACQFRDAWMLSIRECWCHIGDYLPHGLGEMRVLTGCAVSSGSARITGSSPREESFPQAGMGKVYGGGRVREHTIMAPPRAFHIAPVPLFWPCTLCVQDHGLYTPLAGDERFILRHCVCTWRDA